MQRAIPINPVVLRWVRMEAGYSLADAAKFADIGSPRHKKDEPILLPGDRLGGWESGTDAPSLNQLERLAKVYQRPLITFFLPEPPKKIATIADFRTIGDEKNLKDSPVFSRLKRRLSILHQELCALAKDAGSPKLPFIGSLSESTPVIEFVEKIRSTLGVSIESLPNVKNEGALLRYLRNAAHKQGIYVLFEGNLGSHTTKISTDEFRGIALADELAPLVVVNPNDAKATHVFTFIHELAHLWLGSRGVSNLNVFGSLAAENFQERLCNSVAAEFLVPESVLREKWSAANETLHKFADIFSKHFKVSGAVIGRRLLDLKIIDADEYGKLFAYYKARWDSQKEKQKAEQDSDEASGPTRNTLDKFRLGEKTIHTLVTAAHDGRLGLQEAARLMNVSVGRFDKVM